MGRLIGYARVGDMRDKEWGVYAQEPMQAPQHGLTYLARSTHRIAISNYCLVARKDGHVTFRYKDYQRGHRLRTQTLDAVEFLRRLMLHVPPHGVHRMRHFGFLANRVRQEKLAQCRALVGQATPPRARPARGRGPQATRGGWGGARVGVSGVSAWAQATGADPLSTAGGVGPRGAHAST